MAFQHRQVLDGMFPRRRDSLRVSKPASPQHSRLQLHSPFSSGRIAMTKHQARVYFVFLLVGFWIVGCGKSTPESEKPNQEAATAQKEPGDKSKAKPQEDKQAESPKSDNQKAAAGLTISSPFVGGGRRGREGWVVDFDNKRILSADPTRSGTLAIFDLTRPERGWEDARANGEPVKVPDASIMHVFDTGRKLVIRTQYMGEWALRIMDTSTFNVIKTISSSQTGVEDFALSRFASGRRPIVPWSIEKLDDMSKAKAKKALVKKGIPNTAGWFVLGETPRRRGVLIDVMSGHPVTLARTQHPTSGGVYLWQTELGPVAVSKRELSRNYQITEVFHPAYKPRRTKVKSAMKKGKGMASGAGHFASDSGLKADYYPLRMYIGSPSSPSSLWGGSRNGSDFFIFALQQQMKGKRAVYSEVLVATIGAVSGEKMALVATDSKDVVLIMDGPQLRRYVASTKSESSKTHSLTGWFVRSSSADAKFVAFHKNKKENQQVMVLDVDAFFKAQE